MNGNIAAKKGLARVQAADASTNNSMVSVMIALLALIAALSITARTF